MSKGLSFAMKVPSPPPMKAPSISPALYIFTGVVLLRLLVLYRLSGSAFILPKAGDAHFYNDWALRILHGQWTDGHAFYGLPLYPFLLAGIYGIFGYNPYLPGLLQACADGGTAVILFRLGSLIFRQTGNTESPTNSLTAYFAPGKTAGILAAAGWAFFTPAQAYSAILMPTALAVFIFWFVVWWVVGHRTRLGNAAVFCLGCLIGVCAMGVATVAFLIPFIFAALCLKQKAKPGWFHSAPIAASLFLAGLCLGIAPCWVHNRYIAHDPVVLSAHSGVNFWVGNNPNANGYPRVPPGLHAGQEVMLEDSINRAETAVGHPLKRSEVSAYWSRQARQYIRENPAAWLSLIGTKMSNFWSAFQYDDLSIITALREEGVISPGLRFGLIAALAIPGAFIAWPRFRTSRWIVVAILLHMSSLLPVFVTERYRLAAVPGLLLFAAYGLWHLWQSVAARELRCAAAYLALLSCSAWLVSTPKTEASLWTLDSYNSGLHALEANRLIEAEQKLELARAYVPDNAEVNFALGNLRMAQGNSEAARTFYYTTLQLDPQHEGSANNLGVLALGEKRGDLAAKFFSLALKQNPRDAKTYFLRARARLVTGEFDLADTDLTQALKLQPMQPDFLALQDEMRARTLTP